MPKAAKKKVASKAAPVKASKPGIFSAKNRSFGIGEFQLAHPGCLPTRKGVSVSLQFC